MNSILLTDIVRDFHFDVICNKEHIEAVRIMVPDVTRPGLQLAGNFAHFGPDRIQIIGNMETAYLKSLSPEERRKRLCALFSTGIPCLILSRGHEPCEVMIETALKYRVPLLRSKDATANLSGSLVKYLNVELADRVAMHGVLVEVYGEGILILGESGVGKSETALEVVKRGHRLIADDMVEIRKVSDTTLLGCAPDVIRHLIEIRGLGILDVKELFGVSSVKLQDTIHFVINLEYWNEDKIYDRVGIMDETTEILGIEIPSVTVPVRPGRNLAILVEVAAINFRQKNMGYNAGKALTERLYRNTQVEHEDVDLLPQWKG